MSKSSGGGISLGTIVLILIIGYNIFFDDDDEDKKDVEVKKTDDPAIEEEVGETIESIKEDAKKMIEHVKKALEEAFEEDEQVQEEIVEPEEEKPVIASDDKKLEIRSVPEESKNDIPSLQIPKGEQSDQPILRPIE